MTVQIQESVQRRGYAIRPPEFNKLVFLAENFKPEEPISQAEIERSILFGLADLPDKEKQFLLIATSLLSHKEIQKGNAFCYLGGYSFRRLLGGSKGPLSKSSLARIKSSLEAQGLIIRHYDNRHRPLEGGAIDLRPLLARLGELQDRAEEFFQETRDYFSGKQALDRYEYNHSDTTNAMVGSHEPDPNRLKPTKVLSSVQTNNMELPSTRPIDHSYQDQLTADQEGKSSAQASCSTSSNTSICSPEGASEFWKGFEKSGKQRHLKAVSQLKEALQLSEQLSAYIPLSAIETSDENAILDGCYKFIAENFAAKRNTHKTFFWAVKKYGWKAVLLLVCAVEDNTVLSREGWIGHMVKKSNRSLDLSTNFSRIKRQISAAAGSKSPCEANELGSVISFAPAAEDNNPTAVIAFEDKPLKDMEVEPDPYHEIWLEIRNLVLSEEIMSQSEVRSWIDTANILNINQNHMIVAVKTKFHQDCLERDYIQSLEKISSAILDRDIEIEVVVKAGRVKH
ncbi:hypothetical protein O4H49_20005 [Kiloniella laminariae]|uniref:DnaA N-terminal domain-containing protein n=1 Tax=Kiloniella laminariae TaxID=454162 RepID=A0ABT4LPS3_9PROT|nr:hypothetical protein [Kiloniella laminariae]MCZ4283079.1 hypothetical protein [Kiloniella laminariae]